MTVYPFSVGQFECVLIKDGGGENPVSSPEVQAVLREHNANPDVMQISLSPLLVSMGDHRVLVDTGLGGSMSSLPDRLREQGVEPSSIDTVILTHGHPDHVGGLIDGAGEFVYPNARYFMGQIEWDFWTAPDRFPADAASPNPVKRAFQALQAAPERVTLIDSAAEAEIMPGICAVAAPGHTIGQIAVEFTSGSERLLHIADAAHHWFQVYYPQWSPDMDADKTQSAITRQRLFERAAQTGALVSAYHFPFPGVGYVIERDGALAWEQAGNV